MADGSRRDPRTPFQARVQLKVSGLEAFVERFSGNISASGMFVATRSPLPVGRSVVLRVVDHDGQPVFQVTAAVVWTRPPKPDAPLQPGMGLRFLELDESAHRVVEQICGRPPEIRPPAGAAPAETAKEPPPAAEPAPAPPAEPSDSGLGSLDDLMSEMLDEADETSLDDDVPELLATELEPVEPTPTAPPSPPEATPAPAPPAASAPEPDARPSGRVFAQRSDAPGATDAPSGEITSGVADEVDQLFEDAGAEPTPAPDVPIEPWADPEPVEATPEASAAEPTPMPDPFAGEDEPVASVPDGPADASPFDAEEDIDVWEEKTTQFATDGDEKPASSTQQLASGAQAPSDDDTVYVHAKSEVPESAPSAAMEAVAQLLELAESTPSPEAAESVPAEEVSELAMGIDLGTSSSSVCWVDPKGKPNVARPEKSAEKTLPSVVQVTSTAVRVGSPALERFLEQPEHTVEGGKRLLGRKYFSRRVQRFRQEVPYDVVADETGDAAVRIEGQVYPLSWFTTEVLRELRVTGRRQAGENMVRAVLAVPGYFNAYQRHMVVEAGKVAGLEVLGLVNEATAAAVAHGVTRKVKKATVLVYDMGAGGFSASIVRIEKGSYRVLATGDSPKVGGKALDNRVVGWMIDEFQKKSGVDLSASSLLGLKLQQAAEQARITCSKKRKAKITIPDVASREDEALSLNLILTRKKLDELIAEPLDHTVSVCEQILGEAGLSARQIDEIVLSGAATETPAIQSRLKSITKKIKKGVPPADAVSVGAAIIAQKLATDEPLEIVEALTQDVGVAIPGGRFKPAVERNAPLPAEESFMLATSSDNQTFFSVDVYQGHGERVENNEYLGTLEVSGLPARPKGEVQLHFHFKLDTQGYLSVDVVDNVTEQRKSVPMIIKERPPSLADHARITRRPSTGADIGSIYRRKSQSMPPS